MDLAMSSRFRYAMIYKAWHSVCYAVKSSPSEFTKRSRQIQSQTPPAQWTAGVVPVLADKCRLFFGFFFGFFF